MTIYVDPPDDPRFSNPEFHKPSDEESANVQEWVSKWGWAQQIIFECFEAGLQEQFSEESITESWKNFSIEQDPIYYPLLEGMDNPRLAKTFISYWKNAQGMATRSRFWLEHAVAKLMVYQAMKNEKQIKREIYNRAMLHGGMLNNRKPVRELGGQGYFEHMTSSTVWRVALKTNLLDEVDRLVARQERVPATKNLPHDPEKRTEELERREHVAEQEDADALAQLGKIADCAGVEAAPIPISCNLIVVDPNKAPGTPSVLALRYINPRSLESPAQRKQERVNILRLYAYLLQEFPEYREQPNSIRAVAAEILPRHRLTRFPQRYPKYFGASTYWDAGKFWHFVSVPLPIVGHAVRVAGETLHDMLTKQLNSVLPGQQNDEKEHPLKSVSDMMESLPDATVFFDVNGRLAYLRPRKHITKPDPWILSDGWDRPAKAVSWSESERQFKTHTIPTSELLRLGSALNRADFAQQLTLQTGEHQPETQRESQKSVHRYFVRISDNFHYMDSEYDKDAGEFPSSEAAVAFCQRTVRDSLDECYEPGMTPEALIQQYKAFGDDPWIVSTDEEARFSAWTYAEQIAPDYCT